MPLRLSPPSTLVDVVMVILKLTSLITPPRYSNRIHDGDMVNTRIPDMVNTWKFQTVINYAKIGPTEVLCTSPDRKLANSAHSNHDFSPSPQPI